jgi:hypothetical protein
MKIVTLKMSFFRKRHSGLLITGGMIIIIKKVGDPWRPLRTFRLSPKDSDYLWSSRCRMCLLKEDFNAAISSDSQDIGRRVGGGGDLPGGCSQGSGVAYGCLPDPNDQARSVCGDSTPKSCCSTVPPSSWECSCLP